MVTAVEPGLVDFLRQLALFAGLSPEELTRLIGSGREVTVEAGEVLMREGEPGDAMYVILDGEFQVTKQAGASQVEVARRGRGEVLGEVALLEDSPRTATVTAVSRSRLFRIDRQAFFELLEWSPAAARMILKTVSERLRNTESMLRQSEKMAALGTLSAGVAHELNNPAAAARRAAAQLGSELERLEQLALAFNALPLSPEQRAAFAEYQSQLARNDQMARLDPLARSDLENELQEWLEGRGIENGWEIAPQLVGLGLDRAQLEKLAGLFQPEQLPDALQLLAAQGSLQALVAEIASSMEHISSIVKAIKSYSYLDQAPVQEVDVHEGLENTLVIMRYKLKQGVTVKREYGRDLPRMEAYASELNQVWTNIIDNAVDAMKGQGELTIRTNSEADNVIVEICDTGPGIPTENQKRIFEPFYTTKPVGSGTGLGLHITYNIVVLHHHGQITVDSRPGRTCFHVTLPVRMKSN